MRTSYHLLSPIVLLAAALGGCTDPAPQRDPAPRPTADAAAQVAALPAGQRNAVLFRAIRDAGRDCQRVDSAEAAPTVAPGAWIATCDNGGQWLVTLGADGTATIAGGAARPAAAR